MVVEDYEPFRRFVCSTLRNQWEPEIVEVSNGLDAVHKAQELQPDLILLDIGLPILNGIEVARRILEVRPKSKILFLSENRSSDIVEETLRSGALGYVVKSDAVAELITGIETVLQGRQFLSSSLARSLTNTGDESSGAIEQVRTADDAGHHAVGFYSDDEYLVDDVAQFIGSALTSGNAAIVVASASHRDGLLARLKSQGLDIVTAIEQGRCVLLDAADTLATVVIDGVLDRVRFLNLLGGLILMTARTTRTQRREHGRVAIFGECVSLLWTEGKEELAIELEQLSNELLNTYDVEILCAYALSDVHSKIEGSMFQRVCAEHSVVRYIN